MISNPFLFYLLIIILAMIYKFFLKKGGIKFIMDGVSLKRVGIREKESKWGPLISNITLLAVIVAIIDVCIRFIQQEATKIPQLSGGE